MLCPEKALEWDHRKLHLVEELLRYEPTILCLQEVDRFQFLKDQLAQAGYTGIFFPKPDSPCLYSDINYGPDGCAVFWKSNTLSLSQKEDLVLQQDGGIETNQVAIVCTFQTKQSPDSEQLCVAVTHLKSKPPYHQLRHEQGKYLEQRLTKFVPDQCPLIVCGDFNAEPHEPVVETFRSSSLSLSSAYCHLSSDMTEPAYTTWKVRGHYKGNFESKQCIDYIWYTPRHLQPAALLKLPSEDEIGKDRLPSLQYPSDHLSLVADFSWKL